MDNLIKLFYNEADKVHVLIKAAFIHHGFVQIHPFQDGNGRIARLLASFVLIKDNLFPFSLDRDERIAYINALEAADSGDYQRLVDIFADNQIKSIEQALNLETVKKTSYEGVLNVLSEKIASKAGSVSRRQEHIAENMDAVFDLIKKRGEYFEKSLKSKLKTADIAVDASDSKNESYYSFQIALYAKEHRYYFNSSLPQRWLRIRMYFERPRHYQLVLSLHHYGYDNSAFAIGAFMEKEAAVEKERAALSQFRSNEIYTALGVPPLVFSSEKEISALGESVFQQIDALVTAALGYIAEELA
jgi:prophage maintenance system killer protein